MLIVYLGSKLGEEIANEHVRNDVRTDTHTFANFNIDSNMVSGWGFLKCTIFYVFFIKISYLLWITIFLGFWSMGKSSSRCRRTWSYPSEIDFLQFCQTSGEKGWHFSGNQQLWEIRNSSIWSSTFTVWGNFIKNCHKE